MNKLTIIDVAAASEILHKLSQSVFITGLSKECACKKGLDFYDRMGFPFESNVTKV